MAVHVIILAFELICTGKWSQMPHPTGISNDANFHYLVVLVRGAMVNTVTFIERRFWV